MMMTMSQPDVERAETAATSHRQPQAVPAAKGHVGDAGTRGPEDRGWHHGLSPLVAPGLCSPLAMMIMGFDDEEDDAYWHVTHRTRGGAYTDDEESKLESLAASSAQLLLPAPYCEPVEDLLFDRPPGSACGDALPTLVHKADPDDSNKKRRRVRFAIDYPDEILMTTRTTTDEILLAANAAAARTSPILANPCLSPTLSSPVSPSKEAPTLSAAAGPAGDLGDTSNGTTNPQSLRMKKKRQSPWSNDDVGGASTKERYVMGKEEQPGCVRRNRLALVLIGLGLVLICAVAVPLATMSSSSSSNSPSSAIGTAAANRTDNATSSTNGTSLNGSWTEDGEVYNGNRGNRTDAGPTERKCFGSNGELRAAMDTWLWASQLRDEQQETPQALYDLAGTYGWPMNNWCTSNISNMSHLLSVERNPLASTFDQNISRWDVSRVRDFSYLFVGAASFSHDLSRWRVTKATRMDGMFRNATSYNHSLCAWGRRLVIGRGDGSVSVSVSVEDMFRGSGCRSTADPNLDADPPSPLCAPCSSDNLRR
jgi:Mycoplasma protein of unknown function, DUF285